MNTIYYIIYEQQAAGVFRIRDEGGGVEFDDGV